MAKGQSPEKQKPAKQETKTEKVKKDDWQTIANKDIKHKDTKVNEEKEDKRRSNPTKPPPRGPPPTPAPRNDQNTPTSQKFSSGKTNSVPPPRGKQVASQHNVNNNNYRHEEIKDQKVGPKILINPNVAITTAAPKAFSYADILKLHTKPPPPPPVVQEEEEEVEEHKPEVDPLPEHVTYAQTVSHKKEDKKKKYVQKTQESPKKAEPEPEPEPVPEPVHEEEEEPVQDDYGVKEDSRQDEEETYQHEEEERQEEQEQEQEQEEQEVEEREIQEPIPEEKWSPVQDPILPRAIEPVVPQTQPIRHAYRPPQAIPKVETKTKPTKNIPSESVLLPAHLQSRLGAVQYSFGPAEDAEETSPITQGAQTEPNPWPSPEPASRSYETNKAPTTTHSILLETQPAAKLMQPQSPQPPQKPQPPRQPQPLPSQPHAPAALNTTPHLTRPGTNQIQSASATVSPSLKPRDSHVQEIQISNSPERATKPVQEPAHYSPAASPAHSPPHSPAASPPQPPTVAPPILLATNTQQTAPIPRSPPTQPEVSKPSMEESYVPNVQGGYIFESQPIQEPPADAYANDQYNTTQWDDYQAPPPNVGRGSKPNPFLNFGAAPTNVPTPPQNQDKPAGRGSSGHVPQLQQHKPIQPPPMYLPYPFYPPMYGPIYPPMEPNTSPTYEMDYSKGQQYDPKYYGYMYTQQPPWVAPYGSPEAQPAHKFAPAKPPAPAAQKFPAQTQRGRGGGVSYNPGYGQRWEQQTPYPYYPQGAYAHIPNGYPHMSQQGPQ